MIGGDALSVESRTRVVPRDHVVQFYEHDDQLVTSVVDFLVDAVRAGETAIVLATRAHSDAFEAALSEAGIDVAAARLAGRLINVDAGEALSRTLVNGWIDAESFTTEIGGLIRRVADTGRRVRIYGELVGLLWEAGNVAAAIELESLWNALGRCVPFALFCAYPAQSATRDNHTYSFRHVCHLHSAVVADSATVSYSRGTVVVARAEDARSFPCELHALSTARHFVADTLSVWGREKLVHDASIVVAELATNAVAHARSEFIVAISSRGDTVRVSVRDTSHVLPAVQDPTSYLLSGRGLILVAAIARRWGTELITGGKVVWVELGDN